MHGSVASFTGLLGKGDDLERDTSREFQVGLSGPALAAFDGAGAVCASHAVGMCMHHAAMG